MVASRPKNPASHAHPVQKSKFKYANASWVGRQCLIRNAREREDGSRRGSPLRFSNQLRLLLFCVCRHRYVVALSLLSVSAEASSPAAVVVIFFTIKGKLNLINIKGSSRSLAPFIRRVQQTLRRRCVFRVESSSTQPFSQQAIVHCRRAAFVAGTLFSDLRQRRRRRRRRRPPVCLRETSSVAEMHTLAGWLTPLSRLRADTRGVRTLRKWIYW